MITDEKIVCGDCEFKLADIAISTSKEDTTCRFKFSNCPKCGGSSFLTKFLKGNCFIKCDYQMTIENTEFDNDVITSYIKLGARK